MVVHDRPCKYSVYLGSESKQLVSPWLVNHAVGFPSPWRTLIGSNQLWRINDSPYCWEYYPVCHTQLQSGILYSFCMFFCIKISDFCNFSFLKAIVVPKPDGQVCVSSLHHQSYYSGWLTAPDRLQMADLCSHARHGILMALLTHNFCSIFNVHPVIKLVGMCNTAREANSSHCYHMVFRRKKFTSETWVLAQRDLSQAQICRTPLSFQSSLSYQ